MPLFVTAAAGVTVVVLAQRHARSAARAEERRVSQRASDNSTYDSFAERLRANTHVRARPLELSAERLNPPETGVAMPPSESEPGEAYDAISTSALGAEWLTRATEAPPVRQPISSSSEFGDVSTLDLLDDEPSSLPQLSLDLDSKLDLDPKPGADSNTEPHAALEWEALVGDRNPELEQRLRGVFDISDLLQEQPQARAQVPKGRRRSS